ncbi:MAG TPA: NAD(P)-binding domain-containing protein, partial [Dehalococcoidia bacterium]|nr:NAD(P)-binding domain-containing protein [Dehalococcoidia bacterium]
MKLAVVGLGKVGTPLAARAASRGHTVTGCDVNPDVVAAVNRLPVRKQEPLMAELEAFVNAVARDEEPAVTCEDAIVALYLAEEL